MPQNSLRIAFIAAAPWGCAGPETSTDCTDCTTDTGTIPLPIEEGTEVTGALLEGASDTWLYTATGPTWVRVETRTDDPTLDTRLELLSLNDVLMAASDGFPAGPIEGTDDVLVTFLPRADAFKLRVTSQIGGGTGTSTVPATYSLSLDRWNLTTTESPAPVDPLVIADGFTAWTVGSWLETSLDIDTVTFDVQVGGEPLEVYGWAEVPGSDLTPRLTWVDPAGVDVATLDGVGGNVVLRVFDPAPGTWTLRVADAAGGGGSEVYGAFVTRTWSPGSTHPFFGADPWTREVEPNDVVEAAFVTPAEPSYDVRVSQVQGTVDPNDVDHFRLPVEPGELASIRCWGPESGSLLDLEVAALVVGVDVTPFDQGSDPTSTSYYAWDIDPEGALDVVFAVSSLTPSNGAGYRCRLIAAAFPISPGLP